MMLATCARHGSSNKKTDTETSSSKERDYSCKRSERDVDLVSGSSGTRLEAVLKGHGDHGDDHVAEEPDRREPSENPDTNRDASEELGDSTQHCEECPGVKMSSRCKVNGHAMNTQPTKGAKEGASAVVDEDPGERDPCDQQS